MRSGILINIFLHLNYLIHSAIAVLILLKNAISDTLEWILFEIYGETARTINELDELQNVKQRLNQSYSRLNILMLRILEAQPIASNAMVYLLSQSIVNRLANVDASGASIPEIKKGWNLL